MRIMAHVLADTLGTARSNPSWASGIPLLNYTREANTRDLFINGTGTLFFLNVDFPLAGAEAKKAPTKETPKDTAWERARRQVLGNQPTPNSRHSWFLNSMPHSNAKVRRAPKTYQPELVQILLENLANALRSAANIRALKAQDRVWVIVSGPSSLRQYRTTAHSFYQTLHQQQAAPNGNQPTSQNNSNVPRRATVYTPASGKDGTRLTLSVSKRDIDEFDAGVLSTKEFLKKIQHHAR